MREKERKKEKKFNKQKQNTEKSIELECIPHCIAYYAIAFVAIEKLLLL